LGHPKVVPTYQKFMSTAETVRDKVASECGMGLWIDVHGHKQNNLVMLGYDMPKGMFSLSDQTLDSSSKYANETTLRHLVSARKSKLSSFIRGVESFGTYLEQEGIGAVPSSRHAEPAEIQGAYLDGAEIVSKFGSKTGGSIDALQMEVPVYWRSGNGSVSAKQANKAFATAATQAILKFFGSSYSLDLRRLGKGACGNGKTWIVVGDPEKGIFVREGVTFSTSYLSTLKKGSRLEEIEVIGNRLHYRLLRGDGPHTGWVSINQERGERVGQVLVKPEFESLKASPSGKKTSAQSNFMKSWRSFFPPSTTTSTRTRPLVSPLCKPDVDMLEAYMRDATASKRDEIWNSFAEEMSTLQSENKVLRRRAGLHIQLMSLLHGGHEGRRRRKRPTAQPVGETPPVMSKCIKERAAVEKYLEQEMNENINETQFTLNAELNILRHENKQLKK